MPHYEKYSVELAFLNVKDSVIEKMCKISARPIEDRDTYLEALRLLVPDQRSFNLMLLCYILNVRNYPTWTTWKKAEKYFVVDKSMYKFGPSSNKTSLLLFIVANNKSTIKAYFDILKYLTKQDLNFK